MKKRTWSMWNDGIFIKNPDLDRNLVAAKEVPEDLENLSAERNSAPERPGTDGAG